jgi:hypothetical protein
MTLILAILAFSGWLAVGILVSMALGRTAR